MAEATTDDDGAGPEVDDVGSRRAAERGSRWQGVRPALVLATLFVLCIGLAVWLFPDRHTIERLPFAITLSSQVPDPATSNAFTTNLFVTAFDPASPMSVQVVVTPRGDQLFDLRLTWTYVPTLCPTGVAVRQTCTPYGSSVTSLASINLPPGVTAASGADTIHYVVGPKHPCAGLATCTWSMPTRTSTFHAEPGICLECTATPPDVTAPITESWDVLVRGTYFAWSANGANAEATLPSVTFDSGTDAHGVPIGGSASGAVTPVGTAEIRYAIPSGLQYDWNTGPVPIGLTWSQQLPAVAAAVVVGGVNAKAVETDSIDTLIAGALLGIAGGALVGATQELMHRERTPPRARRRRTRATTAD